MPQTIDQIVREVRRRTGTDKAGAKKIVRDMSRISGMVSHFYPEMSPFDFQADLLDDLTSRYVILKKARQIGISQTIAFQKVLKALAMPRFLGIFVSMSLDDAKEKIAYANSLYERIAEKSRVPKKRVDNKMEIEFRNGSKLVSVFTPRGKAVSDIVLDEFAHYANPRKLWQATIPIMVHPGSRLIVASTPLHSWTMFHTIWSGEGNKFRAFNRRSLYWWDSPIHCKNVEEARRKIINPETGERVYPTEFAVRMYATDTLRQAFENMLLEDFQQEFELTEIDDETSLLPWELIISCTPTGDQAITRYHSLQELYEATRDKSQLFAGYDVGRWNDSGELTIYEETEGVLYERYFRTFDEMPFDAQEAELEQLLMLPNMERLAIDKTAMGEQMAESLERKFGHRVLPVHFTLPSIKSMATNIKMYMEKAKVRFYPDKVRSYQMHSIKKSVNEHTGTVGYVVAQGKKQDATGKRHHGDIFWSRALGAYAHADLRALGKPKVRFM